MIQRLPLGALARLSALVALACQAPPGDAPGEDSAASWRESQEATVGSSFFRDSSATHLPGGVLDGLSMDAAVADIDGDGDLDIVVANEFRPNILLLNDGGARFADASTRLPRTEHDSEDVGIADFDGDGDLDIIIVSEDDQTNELYLNDGAGAFTDESARIPVKGTTNGLAVADVDGDGSPDVLLANNGQDAVIINDGSGHFRDETQARLPVSLDVTQDIELGDVDGDGDLDILFANVSAFVEGADPRNRLLINNGKGVFTDETEARLPPDTESSFDGDFRDLDGDGDLDIATGNSDTDLSQRRIAPALFRAYLNDGSGRFTEATLEVFGEGITGTGLDLEFGDFDGDGLEDVYLASRGTADRLLLRVR